MQLVKDGAIPLYYQLKLWLLEQIQRGALAPGSRAPTELELCSRFGLSRGTVRQAIRELIAEGRLYLVRGRGTFVAEAPAGQWSLVDLAGAAGRRAQQASVLALEAVAASPQVAARLQIEAGTGVVYLQRLRGAPGGDDERAEPFALSSAYLPHKLASALLGMDLNNRALYETLEEACGLRVVALDHTVSARLATAEEAALLAIPPGSPVLVVDELAYAAGRSPVEYSVSVYRGDKGSFQLHSERAATTVAPGEAG